MKNMTWRAWLGLGAIGVALTVAVFAVGPTQVALVVGVLLAALVVVLRPQWSVYATFILAFATLPTVVPTVVSIGSQTLRIAEVTLIVAAVWCLFTFKASKAANLALGALLGIIVVWSMVGLVAGNTTADIVKDVRPLILLWIAAVVASRVAGTFVAAGVLRLLPWVLWSAAALVLLASTTGLELTGRSESASLTDLAATDEATRVLTPTNFLALVVVSGCVALALTGRGKGLRLWRYWVPAVVILALAFSRNSLIGVGVALIFALVAKWSVKAFLRVIVLVTTVGIIAFALSTAAPLIAGLPGGAWLNEQVSSYTTRVIDGLDPTVQSSDPSTQFREQSENLVIVPRISESPFIGHGFGARYKDPIGVPGTFFYDSAPLYAHNFYLWLSLKGGFLAIAIFAVVALGALIRAIRQRTAIDTALGAGLAALLACSVVAPMAIGWPTSILLGCLIGYLYPGQGLRNNQPENVNGRLSAYGRYAKV